MKEKLYKEVEALKNDLWEINDFIYNNPELGDQEFKACEKLTNFLKAHNFEVEIGVVDRPTAFRATFDSKKPGATVSYLCEYDALPEVGHGCGHNMIGVMSAGAGIVLSKVLQDIGGKIVVLGTCAEETNGAKVDMAEKGIFDDIDVALIAHPSDKTHESGTSLAMEALQFHFTGKASHAAAAPELGINALNAVILTFNGIDALRQHVTPDVRMHGIVKKGGVAANVVPDDAIAQFYIRAGKKEYLEKVVEKVKNVARGASLMTGAELQITNYEISYDDLKTNKALSVAFNENLKLVGITDINTPKTSFGSIDIGNVSNVVPAIHPYIGVWDYVIPAHSREMAKETISEKGHDLILKGTAALAYTGYDVIVDKSLLQNIKEEFGRIK